MQNATQFTHRAKSASDIAGNLANVIKPYVGLEDEAAEADGLESKFYPMSGPHYPLNDGTVRLLKSTTQRLADLVKGIFKEITDRRNNFWAGRTDDLEWELADIDDQVTLLIGDNLSRKLEQQSELAENIGELPALLGELAEADGIKECLSEIDDALKYAQAKSLPLEHNDWAAAIANVADELWQIKTMIDSADLESKLKKLYESARALAGPRYI